MKASILTSLVAGLISQVAALEFYTGPAPLLPLRFPFGFGKDVIGGGKPNKTNTYLVDNMVDLRTALSMSGPRTVYVKGEIFGNEINETYSADCQWYIDNSNVKQYNFTLYVQSLNVTYVAEVKAAAAANEIIDGRNATEVAALLPRMNGWRGTAQNVQKAYESINVKGNVTIIGWDRNAYLHGVSLIFNVQSNTIIRNLRLSSPRDCFPAPETYPGSWNARYDAISAVTTTGMWVDGNIFEDGPAVVAPDPFLNGWLVDRYDGLFDVEDGSDNITFSHNIVANHHKSLLWGGGEKEGPRDIGKMHFTVFGNHFQNSMSRNPLMRFGTFYIVNNLFENYNNKAPIFTTNSKQRVRRDDYQPSFEYNMGIYNMSNVLVSGNAFQQTGNYPNDTSRIFTFSNLLTPSTPAYFCSPPDLTTLQLLKPDGFRLLNLAFPKSKFNGKKIDLADNVLDLLSYRLSTGSSAVVDGGLKIQDCSRFKTQLMPLIFTDASQVESYVRFSAGQLGKNVP
ncbi:hypothetical protein H072_7795 [Dactylellina haptotyla CBS 200.50]|uniref:Pectate lyase domain-containing protein n=1 Tax=Dactylellina haptotyla (strain CBS 200.50) TaxID=1284197 RepID=S8A620_DACHA|nr:hypothetical protein H072_7795 [Dactylellina haptotyla CBS 200.50]